MTQLNQNVAVSGPDAAALAAADAAAPVSEPEQALLSEAADGDLYFRAADGRVVYVPADWVRQYGDGFPDDAAASVLGYAGNAEVDAWADSRAPRRTPFRADAVRWFTVADLLELPRLTRAQARAADPRLFAFVDELDAAPGRGVDRGARVVPRPARRGGQR